MIKPLAGIEPHIFGLLVRRVNHYTTKTNHIGNKAYRAHLIYFKNVFIKPGPLRSLVFFSTFLYTLCIYTYYITSFFH